MRAYAQLTELERETLQRMAKELGLKKLAEHVGISTHGLNHAIDVAGRKIPERHYEAITNILKLGVS